MPQFTFEPQVVERSVRHDQDVLHFEADTVLAMHVRRDVVCGCTLGELAGASADAFLLDGYARTCPAELIVNRVADPRYLEQRMVAANGHRVRVTIAQAGRAAADRLMALCALNHAHRTAARA